MSDQCPKAPDGGSHHFTPQKNELLCKYCGISQEQAETGRTTETFFITFGSQYSREPHPRADFAHPDGWLEVVVPFRGSLGEAETLARESALRLVGPAWAFIYDSHRFERSKHFYPMGCLARITRDEHGRQRVETFRHFRPRMEETS